VLGAILTASAVFLLLAGVSIAIMAAMTPLAAERIMQPIENSGLMQIFIRDDAAQSDVDALHQEMLADPLVQSVRYVSKDEALRVFKERMKGNPEIVDQLEGNPLPASLELTLKDPRQGPALAARTLDSSLFLKVADNPNDPTKSLKYGQEVQAQLTGVVSSVRLMSWLGAGTVVVAAVVAGILALLLLMTLPSRDRVRVIVWGSVIALALFAVTAVGFAVAALGVYASVRASLSEALPFLAK
jgi:cell division transport system permease protein